MLRVVSGCPRKRGKCLLSQSQDHPPGCVGHDRWREWFRVTQRQRADAVLQTTCPIHPQGKGKACVTLPHYSENRKSPSMTWFDACVQARRAPRRHWSGQNRKSRAAGATAWPGKKTICCRTTCHSAGSSGTPMPSPRRSWKPHRQCHGPHTHQPGAFHRTESAQRQWAGKTDQQPDGIER